MSLLGPPPSRTATFSGTSTSGLPAGWPENNYEEMILACPGGTAQIACTPLTVDFEEDLTYVSTPAWPAAGSSKRWRARIVGGSSRSADGPAGTLTATIDTQTTVGPWLIYNFPHAPSLDGSAYPHGIVYALTAGASADFSGLLTLEHQWTGATLAE